MIDYVVALYFGTRRNQKVQACVETDPYHLLKAHMAAFRAFSTDLVHRVTFVVNRSENREIDDRCESIVQDYVSRGALRDKEVRVIVNEDNRHISYGAWHVGIMSGLDDQRTKYFFVMEDDYVPSGDEFYEPYVKRMASDVSYVCQLWTPSKNPKAKLAGRAAITNGLINADVCRSVRDSHGACFYLEETPDYQHLMKSKGLDDINKKYILSGVAQNYFIRYFLEREFRVIDLGDGWSQLFLDSHGVKPYKEGETSKIHPIHDYKEIKEEDIIG